jgi:hypothetical protein
MTTRIDFLRPRLCGPRFEGAAIPLEFLKDLAVLEELLIEVAKWRYLKDHTERQRSPRGFTEGIEFKLTGIENGSATPIISLFIAASTLILPGMPSQKQTYLEQARESIVSAIFAAEQNQSLTQHLPSEYLGYFDRIGRSLRDDEKIEFTTPSRSTPASYTKDTRRKLVLASRVQETTEDINLRGTIPEADQDKMTFELQLLDGRKLPSPINLQHFDVIMRAFNGYREGIKVSIQGIGRYNRQGRLLSLEAVEHIAILDPLDVISRLDELRTLNDGWYDGEGIALSNTDIDWFADTFINHYPDGLVLPHIYPTLGGNIQAEWSIAATEISLEINLKTHEGQWHLFNIESQDEESSVLKLDDEDSWKFIAKKLNTIAGGEA